MGCSMNGTRARQAGRPGCSRSSPAARARRSRSSPTRSTGSCSARHPSCCATTRPSSSWAPRRAEVSVQGAGERLTRPAPGGGPVSGLAMTDRLAAGSLAPPELPISRPVPSRPVLIASNRGPVTFTRQDGQLVSQRGGGGLVTALTGALAGSGALWVASAMSDEDREQAGRPRIPFEAGDSTFDLRFLSFDDDTYERYYNGIANSVLWFVHHYLWDMVRVPHLDERTRADWDPYRTVNEGVATT